MTEGEARVHGGFLSLFDTGLSSTKHLWFTPAGGRRQIAMKAREHRKAWQCPKCHGLVISRFR
jgi:hypothetical protein